MATYDALVAAGTTTRAAAALTGICRATAARRRARPTAVVREPVVPVNRLTCAERAEVLAVLDSDEFVDAAPIQVLARLLDRGVYLCSIWTMYRILAEHAQVTERRRLSGYDLICRSAYDLTCTSGVVILTWGQGRRRGLGDLSAGSLWARRSRSA